jgi:D-sedoheptulose 7-phosphate isomerase
MNHIHKYISDLQETLNKLPVELIEKVIQMIQLARVNRRQIFVMGNGGSASTASHFAADLGKNTRCDQLPDFRIMCLSDNLAGFSAYANDEGYENVFSRQLSGWIEPDDVVIGISASGNSANVLNAIKLASQSKAYTAGFTGFDGGKLGEMVDVHIHVPSNCIEQVEDIHLVLEHMIVKTVRDLSQSERESAEPVLQTIELDGSNNGQA